MKKIILRALNPVFFVLLVIIGIALQTSLFNSYPFMYLQPDLVLICVIWCALKRPFVEGGILTLLFADMAEIHSATPQGLFLMSYMTVFILVRGLARYVVVPHLSGMVMVALASSIAWKVIYLSILSMMDLAENQWRHTLVLLLPGAVMVGVASVWVFRWLEKFDWVTFKDPRAQKALEDEYQLEVEAL